MPCLVYNGGMSTPRFLTVAAGLLGLVGVAGGTVGAHLLEGRLPPADLEIWRTGVLYQLVHAPAILALAGLAGRFEGRWIALAGSLMAGGGLLFGGSLYLLVLSDLGTGTRWTWAAWITPFGGLAMLAGWACVLVAAPGSKSASGR